MTQKEKFQSPVSMKRDIETKPVNLPKERPCQKEPAENWWLPSLVGREVRPDVGAAYGCDVLEPQGSHNFFLSPEHIMMEKNLRPN